MPRLPKSQLLALVVEAARADGWAVQIVGPTHPFDLVLRRAGSERRVRVYIWNVSHGGATRSAGEYRIQVTGVEAPLEGPLGYQTLILGWDDDRRVFAAFDPAGHRDQSGASSPSIQIGLATLDEASDEEALRVHERGGGEVAVAFPPSLLLPYVEQQAHIHELGEDPDEVQALEAAAEGEEPTGVALPAERMVIVREVASRFRDASFRRRVVAAYGGHCAVCGIQLRLIEAAHIVPVGIATSTDETSNGIALCPLHHEAYDRGLIGIDPDFLVIVNDKRTGELQDAGEDDGLAEFVAALRDKILLPDGAAQRPEPAYLAQGLEARGWL